MSLHRHLARLHPPRLHQLRPPSIPSARPLGRIPLLHACAASKLLNSSDSVPRRWSSNVAVETQQQAVVSPPEARSVIESTEWKPPPECPGCGAPSQNTDPNLPGYYDLAKGRKRLRLRKANVKVASDRARHEDEIWKQALQRARGDRQVLEEMGVIEPPAKTDEFREAEEDFPAVKPPAEAVAEIAEAEPELLETSPDLSSKNEPSSLCHRCHQLIHHNRSLPLASYPTEETIAELLVASPHKHHHIFHLVDAADFPLSVKPKLRSFLTRVLPKKISRNITWTYIITRADVIFPTQEYWDRNMPYFRDTLRRAFPRGELQDEDQILYISSQRGWNVGKVKEMVRKNRGATWFVGGVNVGKSSLLRDVWPQGGKMASGALVLDDAERLDILPKSPSPPAETTHLETRESESDLETVEHKKKSEDEIRLDEIFAAAHPGQSQPLPPPEESQPPPPPPGNEEPRREPPTVTHIPGTTAAPIRVSFPQAGPAGVISRHSNARGEIIDLPGMERWVGMGESGLMKYVQEKRRKDIILQKRVKGAQVTLKPNQALILSGLYVLRPVNLAPGSVLLLNPFTNLEPHVCAADKVARFLAAPDPARALTYADRSLLWQKPLAPVLPAPDSDADADAGTLTLPPPYRAAGTFALADDVTRLRNPKLAKEADALAAPYQVLAADVVLAGVGWVECAAQVRKRALERAVWAGGREADALPAVEVCSPEGRGVGVRRCLAAWCRLQDGHKTGTAARAGRPRRPMKGAKKMAKLNARRGT